MVSLKFTLIVQLMFLLVKAVDKSLAWTVLFTKPHRNWTTKGFVSKVEFMFRHNAFAYLVTLNSRFDNFNGNV